MVISTRKQAKHASGVGVVIRLAENAIIHDNNRVSAQNEVIWPGVEHRQCLLVCQTFCAIYRALSFPRCLWNICSLHDERNACVSQKLLTTWRGRSKDQG